MSASESQMSWWVWSLVTGQWYTCSIRSSIYFNWNVISAQFEYNLWDDNFIIVIAINTNWNVHRFTSHESIHALKRQNVQMKAFNFRIVVTFTLIFVSTYGWRVWVMGICRMLCNVHSACKLFAQSSIVQIVSFAFKWIYIYNSFSISKLQYL